jgi:hypothetical protein
LDHNRWRFLHRNCHWRNDLLAGGEVRPPWFLGSRFRHRLSLTNWPFLTLTLLHALASLAAFARCAIATTWASFARLGTFRTHYSVIGTLARFLILLRDRWNR